MRITPAQYKNLNNDKELQKSKNRLKKWFNLFIRLRDFTLDEATGLVEGECIACGKRLQLQRSMDGSIYNGRDFHASHFFNTDQHALVEYDEENVNLSCNRCNSPLGLHGNKENYQINLIKKIGQDRFEALNRRRNKTKKWNILEIDVLAEEYWAKAKAEARRLGVKT